MDFQLVYDEVSSWHLWGLNYSRLLWNQCIKTDTSFDSSLLMVHKWFSESMGKFHNWSFLLSYGLRQNFVFYSLMVWYDLLERTSMIDLQYFRRLIFQSYHHYSVCLICLRSLTLLERELVYFLLFFDQMSFYLE